VIRTLIAIALNRDLQGGDPVYIRCARCGTIGGEMEGTPLRMSSPDVANELAKLGTDG
jgi:hypothetical protein